MTQEENELLLRDLCARLPYGVMVRYFSISEGSYIDTELLGYYNGFIHVHNSALNPKIIKPYLRSMSNMTEDEEDEWHTVRHQRLCDEFDWLNKKMFDYRGLILIGLALPAPEGMYYLNEE